MKVFYDFEFLEDGRTIDPISLGMVREDGKEYEAVFSDAPWHRIKQHKWLCENVVPHLPLIGEVQTPILGGVNHFFEIDKNNPIVKPGQVIANEVRTFLQGTPDLELWAYYADYDHVALAQLWGPMINLPKGIPMRTNDLQQECERLGNPTLPREPMEDEHNALADARWDQLAHSFLERVRIDQAAMRRLPRL